MFLELVILVVSLLLFYVISDNYFPRKRLPPGPLRLPIVGSALTMLRNRSKPPFVTFRDLSRKYGPITFMMMGEDPTVLVEDFDTAKKLLNDEIWIDRPYDSLVAERSYGKPLGIIFVSGDGWREMRRFSMRTLRDFGYGKQANMQSVIDDEVTLLMEKLEKVASSGSVLKVKHIFNLPVLNILWSMVSAVRNKEEDEKQIKKLVLLVDNLLKATPMGGTILDLFPWLRHIAPGLTGMTFVRQCVSELQQYFQQVLDERREEGGYKGEGDGRDFIDMFIREIERHRENGIIPNHYTDEQFVTTVTDLFEAGSETSSNTLEFAVYYAMKNPRVQKRVQEEMDRVVGRSRLPVLADKAQMPYTEATLIEVQRMANVLPMTARSNTQDCTIMGYHVGKGTMAVVNIYSIHMNKEFWGDPYVFRPERFLDKDNKIIMQKASRVIPFGAGKRVCLGETLARSTLFSYFTALLQSYSFEDIEKDIPNESDNKACNSFLQLSESPDPDTALFQKWVNVGFTLSPHPYETKLIKRN